MSELRSKPMLSLTDRLLRGDMGKLFPVVDEPGPDCFDRERLCISVRCPHALTPLITKKSNLPLSRCALDMPSRLNYNEMESALGIDRHRIVDIERRALSKLRHMARNYRD